MFFLKRIAVITLIAFALMGGNSVTGAARAQESTKIPLVIGILDSQAIMKTSKAGKSLDAALKAKQKAIQENIQAQEKKLRAEQASLMQQRSTLAQADWEKKESELRQKIDGLRAESEKQRKAFLAARDSGFQQIVAQVDKVVQGIARERGLTLIVNKSLVILSADAWDITPEVLKRLDAALPSVKI